MGRNAHVGARRAAAALLAATAMLGGAEVGHGEEIRMLLARVDFSDRQGEPITQATAQSYAQFFGTFYKQQSFDKVNLTQIDITPVLRLTRTRAYYDDGTFPMKSLELAEDAKARVEAAGYNLANYTHFVMYHPAFTTFTTPGIGPPYAAQLGGAGYALLLAHEMGHSAFGFAHAASPGGETADNYEVMGYSPRIEPQTVNLCMKRHAGWITDAQIQDVTQSGTYVIQEHSNTTLGGRPLGLRIRRSDTQQYYVGFRQDIPARPEIHNGVTIHSCPRAPFRIADAGYTYLSSVTALGQNFSDNTAGVTVRPVRKLGTNPETVEIEVTLAQNRPQDSALTVLTPMRAEQLGAGMLMVVHWRGAAGSPTVNVDLSANNGGSWMNLATGTPNDGREVLVAPSVNCVNTCRIRVQAPGGNPSDVSDDGFTIMAVAPSLPEVIVDWPNGGETLVANTQATVRWKTAGTLPRVRIELSTNGGGTYQALVADTPNDGSETITVPNMVTANARIRLRDFRLTTRDTSDFNFAIAPPGTVVPDGGVLPPPDGGVLPPPDGGGGGSSGGAGGSSGGGGGGVGGGGGAAGTGGASGGGMTGAGGTSGGGTAGGGGEDGGGMTSGCACGLGGRSADGAPWWLGLAFVALAARRRTPRR